ncbi:MAG TPA: LysM peptidoglycan-binding domain-containing protein [Phycisphaerales bacterium]|nr:LysM peptidoglycan-binding domain-containing protein [Phycisphaerales bacterium]
MTRELKLSLILGFSLVLVVTVLVSDYLSKARMSRLDGSNPAAPVAAQTPPTADMLLTKQAQQEEQLARAEREQALEVSNTHRDSAGAVEPAPRTGAQPAREIAMGGEPEHKPFVIDQGTGRENDLAGIKAPAGATPAASTDRVHKVVEGDTLYQIAQKYYRNGSLHAQLQKYNDLKSSGLKVGSTVKVPTLEVLTGKISLPAPEKVRVASNDLEPLVGTSREGKNELPKGELPAANDAAGKNASYTVKKGDTLGHIAQRELGTSRRSKEILSLNSGMLKTPEDLRVGMVLKLPAK